jgi:hypothetical protein
VVSYLVLPYLWRLHEREHPALADVGRITRTASGIPGDPVNVGLIASETDLDRAMLATGWYPADPITLGSSLLIAADVVFRRPYVSAPVSSLYLLGRKEDLAFEQPVGDDPSRRHHVRLWRSEKLDELGRPLWSGSATLDLRVGFSSDTGQITHHISPDVDGERDKILNDLRQAGKLSGIRWIDGFHTELSGRNGEGDPWRTDGRLGIGIISEPMAREGSASRPTVSPSGPASQR